MLAEVCKELVSRGYEAEVIEKEINNGVTKKGISIFIPGAKSGPVLYEDWIGNYFPEQDPKTVAASLVQDISEKKIKPLRIPWSSSKDFYLQNSSLRAVKKDWNDGSLQELIWRPIGKSDLVWYVIIVLEDTEQHGTYCVKVPKRHLDLLGLSEDELFEAAQKNTADSLKIMSMKDAVKENLKEEGIQIPDEIIDAAFPEDFTVILTNNSGFHGAAAGLLPESLEKARKELRVQKMTVIPSSVHEVMCFPIEVDEKGVDMVREVNAEHIRKEDWLSEHPFIWDGKTLRSIEK